MNDQRALSEGRNLTQESVGFPETRFRSDLASKVIQLMPRPAVSDALMVIRELAPTDDNAIALFRTCGSWARRRGYSVVHVRSQLQVEGLDLVIRNNRTRRRQAAARPRDRTMARS